MHSPGRSAGCAPRSGGHRRSTSAGRPACVRAFFQERGPGRRSGRIRARHDRRRRSSMRRQRGSRGRRCAMAARALISVLMPPGGGGAPPAPEAAEPEAEGSRRFFLIDAARDVVLRSATTTQARSHMVVVLEGSRKAFAANIDSDTVTLLKLPELRIVKHIRVGDGPEGIDATPNGKWVLVALQGADQVAILDAGSGAVLSRLPAGRLPVRVAVTPNSFNALVSNRASNDVTVLDILARRVTRTGAVGEGPGGGTTNAPGSRAQGCNNDSNSVSGISLPGV